MRKTFTLDEIDCANCAAKLEAAVRKVEGVKYAAVNFFAQKMIIEVQDSEFDSVMKKVINVCKKQEPDCRII